MEIRNERFITMECRDTYSGMDHLLNSKVMWEGNSCRTTRGSGRILQDTFTGMTVIGYMDRRNSDLRVGHKAITEDPCITGTGGRRITCIRCHLGICCLECLIFSVYNAAQPFVQSSWMLWLVIQSYAHKTEKVVFLLNQRNFI